MKVEVQSTYRDFQVLLDGQIVARVYDVLEVTEVGKLEFKVRRKQASELQFAFTRPLNVDELMAVSEALKTAKWSEPDKFWLPISPLPGQRDAVRYFFED